MERGDSSQQEATNDKRKHIRVVNMLKGASHIQLCVTCHTHRHTHKYTFIYFCVCAATCETLEMRVFAAAAANDAKSWLAVAVVV